MTEDQIAMFHGQPGYRGFTGLADRENGTVMGISFWETEADMRAGEESGREASRRVGEAGGTKGEPVVDRRDGLIAISTHRRLSQRARVASFHIGQARFASHGPR